MVGFRRLGVDLYVEAGEGLVVLGPSGSGKSTLLRVVAGLVYPSAGRVFIGGRDVTDLPPDKRGSLWFFKTWLCFLI